MALRRLASLLAGVLLLAALGLSSAAPAVRADDTICATKPDLCVTMRMNVSGYVDGHGFDQFMPSFWCDHVAGQSTASCQWDYGVATTKVITITAQANNPAGVTVCIGTQCGPSPQSKDFTLTSGQRGPSANITINPTNGAAVTITKGGTGTGTVTSDKGGINCGSTCNWTFFDDVLVILTASPTGDSTFAGWSDAGTCTGQDATCHLLTGPNVSIQALFNGPTAPPPSATPTTPPTATPTKTPTPSGAKTPAPSAGHTSGAPTFKPPSIAPGSSIPGAATQDPTATQNDIPSTADPNAGPTPTPFKFASDDPNRTDNPANVLPSPPPVQPTGDSGSGPPWVTIGLIVLLGLLIGGGVFWWARRRGAAA